MSVVVPTEQRGHFNKGVGPMTWGTPSFVEVKMDAEVTSYQDDLDGV